MAAVNTLDFCLINVMKSSLGTRALKQKKAFYFSTKKPPPPHLVAAESRNCMQIKL